MSGVNVWGTQTGPEVQRSDLWAIDLGVIETALGTSLSDDNGAIFACSIDLPSLRINPEVIRAESRPKIWPGMDVPLEEVRITFFHDVSSSKKGDIYESRVYRFLTNWRSLARSGRDNAPPLDNNFSAIFKFDINVLLLHGVAIDEIERLGSANADDPDINKYLEVTAAYTIVGAWPASIKIDDLSYTKEEVLRINVGMACDDFVPQAQ